MTTSSASHPFWSFEAPSRDPAAARAASTRMPQSPQQARADLRTSLVREITDAATKERNTKVARLRQARLAQEAAEKVEALTSNKRAARPLLAEQR